MRHQQKNYKGIALAISFFAFFAYSSSSLLAQTVITQSSCFTITATLVTDGSHCNASTCGPTPYDIQSCDTCCTIKICMDQCPGLTVFGFSISSHSLIDCHSICSPNGDFTIPNTAAGDLCSWYDPRGAAVTSSAGLSYTHCAYLRICHRKDEGAQVYDIGINPSTTTCGTLACTVATVSF